MKNILKITLVVIITILLTGCKKYDKLAYTSYNEYFNSKDGYVILDKTSDYDIDVRRYLEAGNGNVQVYYIEFATEDLAIDYVKNLYENQNGYKVKNNYSYVKSTKNQYFKLYRVDNVIINAVSSDKKYRKNVNEVLKDLGY